MKERIKPYKKKYLLYALAAAAGFAVLAFAGKGIYDAADYWYNNQVGAGEYAATTRQVILNGQTYVSGDVIREKDGTCYIPLPMLINVFGWEASASRKLFGYELGLNGDELYIPLYEGGGITRNGAPCAVNHGVAYIDGLFYLSTDFIKEIYGCHVYEKQIEGSERSIYADNYQYKEMDYSWASENQYICHAMGLIDGYDYTNSKEAFLSNYEKGYRVYEVDLQLTSDGKLAAVHGWGKGFIKKHLGIEWDGEAVPLEEFLQIKIQGRYTPLSFYDIVELMEQYPDTYLVLDCKGSDYETVMAQYRELVKEAGEINPDMLKRMIPQIYSEEMLEWIREAYDWNSVIYTLYQMPLNYSQERVMQFSYENGIKVVTMGQGKARDMFVHELTDRGIYTYVHTINDENVENEYRIHGVWGFYTDELYEPIKQ